VARPRVRERLLDAAYMLLRDEGAGALTTRGVAAKAGTTEASVFNNFGDKAGMLRALINERLPELVEAKDCVEHGSTEDLRQWLELVYHHAERFYITGAPLTASFWTGSHRDNNGGAPTDNLFLVHYALCQRLQRLQEDGRIARQVNARAIAYLLLGAALHNALDTISQRFGCSYSPERDGGEAATAKATIDSVHRMLVA